MFGLSPFQIALQYNIPPPPDYSAFTISAIAVGVCNSTVKTLSVTVVVRCVCVCVCVCVHVFSYQTTFSDSTLRLDLLKGFSQSSA